MTYQAKYRNLEEEKDASLVMYLGKDTLRNINPHHLVMERRSLNKARKACFHYLERKLRSRRLITLVEAGLVAARSNEKQTRRQQRRMRRWLRRRQRQSYKPSWPERGEVVLYTAMLDATVCQHTGSNGTWVISDHLTIQKNNGSSRRQQCSPGACLVVVINEMPTTSLWYREGS